MKSEHNNSCDKTSATNPKLMTTIQPELWERLPCGCGTVCDCVCELHAFDGESQVCVGHQES